MAEDPSWPAMWLMARCHLLCRKICMSFISVFNHYRKALDQAEMLEQKGCAHIYIVVIDADKAQQGKVVEHTTNCYRLRISGQAISVSQA